MNPAFTRLTGYDLDEVLGRNCRFLQGPNTDPTSISRIRSALADERPITEVLLNYRRDGTAFWNQVSISPVFDGSGNVVNFVGVQADVTERVMVENERRAALAAAEETREQLRLLTDSTAAMTASLDAGGAARALARIVVPALADYCCVDLLDEVGLPTSSHRVAVNHRDDTKTETVGTLGRWITPTEDGDDPVDRVLAGGAPSLLPELPVRPEGLRGESDLMALYEQLRPRSAIVVPLRARGQVLGALTLGTELPYGRRYSQRDLYLASDLAARAGLAVDNARLYAREHGAAETLQRSLLPAVPEVPGLTVASRYLAATDGAQVGGDWYDLLPLPDGAVGVAVGDVVGHDLRAAAAMGELRGVLRSYAWEGLAPDAVIDRCNDLVQGLGMAAMATAVFGRLERATTATAGCWATATPGTRRPCCAAGDGTVELLTGNLSPLIGATREARAGLHRGALPARGRARAAHRRAHREPGQRPGRAHGPPRAHPRRRDRRRGRRGALRQGARGARRGRPARRRRAAGHPAGSLTSAAPARRTTAGGPGWVRRPMAWRVLLRRGRRLLALRRRGRGLLALAGSPPCRKPFALSPAWSNCSSWPANLPLRASPPLSTNESAFSGLSPAHSLALFTMSPSPATVSSWSSGSGRAESSPRARIDTRPAHPGAGKS